MATAALNVFGLVMGVVSLIPLAEQMIPDTSYLDTVVTIGVGGGDDKADTKGDRPGIRLFDEYGRDIGERRGNNYKTLKDGTTSDPNRNVIKIKASEKIGSKQATYISVSKGGDDALCISYISVKWPDKGTQMWTGDIGYQCGGHWYPSNTIVAGTNSYKSKCTWIDGNASNGITTQGMGIHLIDFVANKFTAEAFAQNQSLLCDSKPRFHLYDYLTSDYYLPVFDPPLQYDDNHVDLDPEKVLVPGKAQGKQPPENKKDRHKRAQLAKRNTFPGKLVTSVQPAHSAKELCESDMSFGPDFVSYHEGLFCDMSEKQLWPVCQEASETDCFDNDTRTMRAPSLSGRDVQSGAPVPTKDYHSIEDW